MKIKVRDKSKWHDRFVWLPLKIDDTWVWLEHVLARKKYIGWSEYKWQYTLRGE